jgi:hypothetical protein
MGLAPAAFLSLMAHRAYARLRFTSVEKRSERQTLAADRDEAGFGFRRQGDGERASRAFFDRSKAQRSEP